MIDFKDFISEGLEDTASFKAIMMAGGAGSGKSFVIALAGLRAYGMKVSNSDPNYERMLAKAGLTLTPDDIASAQGQAIRGDAKILTDKQKEQWLKGRLGLIVDGTGKDLDDVKEECQQMMDMGYEVGMIFVNTPLETSIERDKNRKRTIGPKLVTQTWKRVQANRNDFKRMFGKQFIEIENATTTTIEDLTAQCNKALQKLKPWINKEPTHAIYKNWKKAEMKKKGITSFKRTPVK
jgi:dephospho-CoA kinase